MVSSYLKQKKMMMMKTLLSEVLLDTKLQDYVGPCLFVNVAHFCANLCGTW